jgi:hypothetical protein
MVIVQQGQTIVDIAIQHCGKFEAIVDIVKANGIEDYTQNIAAGSYLQTPQPLADEQPLVAYLQNKNIVPSSNISEAQQQQQQQEQGINYWAIEEDFVIS